MSQVKGIPYGISDFNRIRNGNFYFVDKTMYLPLIEKMPSYLFLIRPRRFGKSVFLSMMRTYYDILRQDDFDAYFGDLWIGTHPTGERNKYQVLYFDFSKAGCSMPGADLMTSFNDYCGLIINQFAHVYAAYYDADFKETVEHIESAKSKLAYIEVKAKEKGYPLYLIIDEYDNFTNVILSEHGQRMFHDLTHASGFYREYFKQFKGMFDRIFMMGVSPVTLDDLSSGYNIDWNISVDPRFNVMMGFDETDVREMFRYYQQNDMLKGDAEAMITEMKPWYDNYCFAEKSYGGTTMYNSNMVLYFVDNYIRNGGYMPRNMVEENIRVDYNKLRMLIRKDKEFAHDASTIQTLVQQGYITGELKTGFPAETIAEPDNFISLLFYFGMLTISGTKRGKTLLTIPNQVVREQLYSYLLDTYNEANLRFDNWEKGELASAMAYDGDWKAYFNYIAECLHRYSSQRDKQKGEAYVHGFTLAMTAQNRFYRPISEQENQEGYADIFMFPLLDIYKDMLHSYIIELKYVKGKDSDEKVEQLRQEAITQANRYAASETVQKAIGTTTLHKIIVVYQGMKMVVCEEV